MKIAVVIPAYNVARYLVQCLDSLMNQTVPVEVYCCDDGSTDETPAILDAYAAAHPRVHAYHHANSGSNLTYNAMLDALPADVDAFGIVDADDYVHPAMFAALAEALARCDADVAECGIARVPDDAVQPAGLPGPSGAATRVIDDMSVFWVRRTCVGPWINKYNKLYRRSAVGHFRFYDRMPVEDDFLYACEVNAVARRKAIVPGVCYGYRMNPSSITGALNFRKYAYACAKRLRLSSEKFLLAGRVPPALVDEWRRDLAKDAYRMLIRKNLKKNPDAAERRALFLQAADDFDDLVKNYGFAPLGLNPVQRLLYELCRRRRYALARILVYLT